MRNRAFDLLRKNHLAKESSNQSVSIYAIDETHVWEGILSQDLAREIEQAMGALRTEEREVIALHIYSEMTFEQISDALEAPVGTVASLYRRAIEKLRRKLKGLVSP